MSSYTTEVDKLERDTHHLVTVLQSESLDEDQLDLALSIAKRCRRQCNNVVRAIARHRDKLQPEGTS